MLCPEEFFFGIFVFNSLIVEEPWAVLRAKLAGDMREAFTF